MKRQTMIAVSVLMLAALVLAACQALPSPMIALAAAPDPAAPEGKQNVMDVIDQFFAAYETYDTDKLLALHTDDAVWTWIDEGKNFPNFGPEGIWIGTGREEIGAMFDFDRGESGITGYILWADVSGNNVKTVEVWESAYSHAIDVPLIARSTYKLNQGKITEWEWRVSAESSGRFMNTPDPLAANMQLLNYINENIWNQGKVDLIDQYYVSGYVRHEIDYPADPPGAEGLKQFITALRTGFPDWNCTAQDMFAASDKVVGRYLCQGTHTGNLMGLPPTGRHVQFSDTIIHKISDGKIVEDWSDYDTLGYFVQLGFTLVPPGQ